MEEELLEKVNGVRESNGGYNQGMFAHMKMKQ